MFLNCKVFKKSKFKYHVVQKILNVEYKAVVIEVRIEMFNNVHCSRSSLNIKKKTDCYTLFLNNCFIAIYMLTQTTSINIIL